MGFGIQGTSDATSVWQQQQQNGQSLRPFANLDLSEQQRTQVRSVFQNAKSQGLTQAQVKDQIDAILTPDQQATLQADQAAQPAQPSQPDVQNAPSANSGHHHHHHHGAGGSSSSSSDPTAASSSSAASSSAGLTETDVQNQVLAAASLTQQQIQNDVFTL